MAEEFTVYAADETAIQFALFQKHYSNIKLLLESGVFEEQNSTVLLDFDKFGVIKTIRRNDYLYNSRN